MTDLNEKKNPSKDMLIPNDKNFALCRALTLNSWGPLSFRQKYARYLLHMEYPEMRLICNDIINNTDGETLRKGMNKEKNSSKVKSKNDNILLKEKCKSFEDEIDNMNKSLKEELDIPDNEENVEEELRGRIEMIEKRLDIFENVVKELVKSNNIIIDKLKIILPIVKDLVNKE